MEQKKETFELTINTQRVEVVNEGTKLFEEQSPQAMADLKSWIAEEISKGNSTGWTPYNNFESSVGFTII